MVEHSGEVDEIPNLKWPRRFPVPRDSGVPKGSRIVEGKSWPAPEGPTRIATLRIYRYEPDNDDPPRIDTFRVDLDDCGPMLAKQTPGAVTVEAVDLTDVTDFAREVDLVAPGDLEAALDFAFAVMTGVDREGIAARATTIAAARHRAPPEAHELAAIRYQEVGDDASLIALFDALEAAQGARTFRPEILRTCIKALRSTSPDVSFLEAVKRIREQQRVLGQLLPKKAVGSPLLLKGLEGDVAVILDASDFDRDAAKNRKNLYVALTRGSRKLVVCSPTDLLG
ncbi:MAG: hypothetical protein Q4P24_15715 [Rhodobacterales bacterium]|nr:hypothetical protein [Rhodobacterales bacterium]